MEHKISEYLPRGCSVLTQKTPAAGTWRYGTPPFEFLDRDPLKTPKGTQAISNVLCLPSELDSKTLFLKT